MSVVHWDDVERRHRAVGELDATWRILGEAAGTVTVGVNLAEVPRGKLPTPPHSHQSSEEVYFVLRGSGLAWQDGNVHEVRTGDCIIQRANERSHTFVAGPDGLDYLVFGTRHRHEMAWLPRSGALLTAGAWVHGRLDDPWELEAQAPPLDVGEPAPRPANILNVDEVELEETGPDVTTAPLATRERSDQAGFHWERIGAGATGSVPHCHSEEEEVFVILDGEGILELWPSPRAAERGVIREDVPLRAGHLVARPPGTGVAHAFRAGPKGLTMLIYGTRRPNDLCYYPRSNKIGFRGLGVIGRLESLDYWDGEERDQ
jgi:uncharacterized cupin superfamily protein